MRHRIIRYVNSRWGLVLLALSAVVTTATMFVLLMIEGWQFGEGGSSTSRSANLLAPVIVALVFALPFIIVFNLACFLVWWAVTAITER